MIVNVIGVRRVTGTGDRGAYDFFKIGYTTPFPKNASGSIGELGGSCTLKASCFPDRIPHVGDRLLLDVNFQGRILGASFLEDII